MIGVHVSIRIKKRGIHIVSKSVAPENRLAPEILSVRQTVGEGELIYDVGCNIRRATSIWTLRRTVDDFIFSVELAIRTLEVLGEETI